MQNKGTRILLVEDEPQIRKLLRVALNAHGFAVEEAVTGEEGQVKIASGTPEIAIIDLGLPDMDGKQLVRQVREWSQIPIIILTAHDQEEEKIEALDAGADDYVTKPFSVGELMARMRVLLRRVSSVEYETVIVCGDLILDLPQRRVTVAGQEVKLTPTEYDILRLLAQHRGKVLTHRQILKAVWGNAYEDTHYTRTYVGQLRRKIEADPTRPQYILTESGVGYRLMCPAKMIDP